MDQIVINREVYDIIEFRQESIITNRRGLLPHYIQTLQASIKRKDEKPTGQWLVPSTVESYRYYVTARSSSESFNRTFVFTETEYLQS